MGWLWTGRSSSNVVCHFCNHSLELIPRDYDHRRHGKGKARVHDQHDSYVAIGVRNDWICTQCRCRNHLDRKRFVSSLNNSPPSRITETLTTPILLYTVRPTASPSRAHLTSSTFSTPTSPFCRTCLSNQSLQIHLLASYSPSDSEEDHPSTSSSIDTYKTSLDSRYPLVCSKCLPQVEHLIKQRDYKAKTSLFALRLRSSKTSPLDKRKKTRAESIADKVTRKCLVVIWGVRGGLWFSTWFETLRINFLLVRNPDLSLSKWLSYLAILSLLWTNWDPTWLRTTRYASSTGRKLNVVHRRIYVVLQMIAYFLRLTLIFLHRSHFFPIDSSQHRNFSIITFLLFSMLFISSFRTIRIIPPKILKLPNPRALSELIDPKTISKDPLDPIESLSISSSHDYALIRNEEKIRRRSHQMMKKNRMDESNRVLDVRPDEASSRLLEPSFEMEEMDWTPLPANANRNVAESSVVALAPGTARWPSMETPTGLEGLFEKGLKVDDAVEEDEIMTNGDENDGADARLGWLRSWFG